MMWLTQFAFLQMLEMLLIVTSSKIKSDVSKFQAGMIVYVEKYIKVRLKVV